MSTTTRRIQILLGAQRALLGGVVEQMRGVAVCMDSEHVTITFYIDGEVSDAVESECYGVYSELHDELDNRLSDHWSLAIDIIRCDAPAELCNSGEWVYRRREPDFAGGRIGSVGNQRREYKDPLTGAFVAAESFVSVAVGGAQCRIPVRPAVLDAVWMDDPDLQRDITRAAQQSGASPEWIVGEMRVMLSLQKALIGLVSPAVCGISAKWTGGTSLQVRTHTLSGSVDDLCDFTSHLDAVLAAEFPGWTTQSSIQWLNSPPAIDDEHDWQDAYSVAVMSDGFGCFGSSES